MTAILSSSRSGRFREPMTSMVRILAGGTFFYNRFTR